MLRAALLADHADPESDKDFGKNIIPTLLGQGKNLFAYQFSGYWKDVGTIPSYYSTQMELLGENAEFRLHDTRMHILSNFNEHPSHFIGRDGRVEHSMICNGCEIYGEVYNSILSPASRWKRAQWCATPSCFRNRPSARARALSARSSTKTPPSPPMRPSERRARSPSSARTP